MSLYSQLAEKYPHGHHRYIPLTLEELQLHSDKNNDYAAGGSPIGNFSRVAHILGLYPKMDLADPIIYCLALMMKQLDAIFWGLSQNIVHKREGLDGRFADICVYIKIARCMWRDRTEAEAKETEGDHDREPTQS